MRRFKKKPELSFIVIPGVGRISSDRVLEGDQYAKFCPSILVELPAEASAAPTPPVAPRPSAPPAVIIPPPPPPPPAHLPDPLTDTVETPIHIPPEAIPPKHVTQNEAFPTAEELKAAVEQENKQTEEQIEKVVESLAPVEEPAEKEEPAKESKKPAHHQHKKPSGKKTPGKK